MIDRLLNYLLNRNKALRQQFLTRAAVFIAIAAFIQAPVHRYLIINPRTQWVPGAMIVVTAIALVVYVLARRGYLVLGTLLLLFAVLSTAFVNSTPDDFIDHPMGAMLIIPIAIASFMFGMEIALILVIISIISIILASVLTGTTNNIFLGVNISVIATAFGLIWIIHRLTDQLHVTNRHLQETNEREQRARAFIGFFQHELKSYTTALEGLIEIFKPSITATIDERSALVLNELDLGIERLNNLARQLMVLSHEGIVPYQMHDIALAPLFRQAKADIEAAGMRYHLPLVVEMHVADDLQVCGDSQYLALAIGTALRNALEASAHQPRQQEAMQISLSALRQGQRVVIRVEDTGPGFPAPILEALEEATGHRALPLFGWSTKSTGTGLGLPLILHVAHLHAGRARFRNTMTGACVEFDVAGGSTTGMTQLVSATNH